LKYFVLYILSKNSFPGKSRGEGKNAKLSVKEAVLFFLKNVLLFFFVLSSRCRGEEFLRVNKTSEILLRWRFFRFPFVVEGEKRGI